MGEDSPGAAAGKHASLGTGRKGGTSHGAPGAALSRFGFLRGELAWAHLTALIVCVAPVTIGVAALAVASAQGRHRAVAQGPDRSYAIVFTGALSGGVGKELFTIGPDGGMRIQHTATDAVDESSPSWAPDRRQIAYVVNLPPDPIQGDDLSAIEALDLTTHLTRTLTVGPVDVDPDWHPNGTLIAFVSLFGRGTAAQGSAISVVGADGSDPRPLIQLQSPDHLLADPDWSPDGLVIAFVARSKEAGGQLLVMNAEGTGAQLLHRQPGRDLAEPAWSPDGRRIAYASGILSGGLAARHDIAVIDLVTGVVGSVAVDEALDLRSPAWSPDGKEIVFHAIQAGAEELGSLYVVPSTGGDRRGPLAAGIEPDWMGAGALPAATASPVASPGWSPSPPGPTAEATNTPPPMPSLPVPATLPAFPSFPPPLPTVTRGPLPTFPPPPASASPTIRVTERPPAPGWFELYLPATGRYWLPREG